MNVAVLTGSVYATRRGWVAHCRVCHATLSASPDMLGASKKLHVHNAGQGHLHRLRSQTSLRGNGSGNSLLQEPTNVPQADSWKMQVIPTPAS